MRDKVDIQRDAWLGAQLRHCEEAKRLLQRLQGSLKTAAHGLSSTDEAKQLSLDILDLMVQLRVEISKEFQEGVHREPAHVKCQSPSTCGICHFCLKTGHQEKDCPVR